jgi:hypothetical protein
LCIVVLRRAKSCILWLLIFLDSTGHDASKNEEGDRFAAKPDNVSGKIDDLELDDHNP